MPIPLYVTKTTDYCAAQILLLFPFQIALYIKLIKITKDTCSSDQDRWKFAVPVPDATTMAIGIPDLTWKFSNKYYDIEFKLMVYRRIV